MLDHYLDVIERAKYVETTITTSKQYKNVRVPEKTKLMSKRKKIVLADSLVSDSSCIKMIQADSRC